MNWFIKILSSTLGRKLLMALTGLFLILFLVVHLIGNLQLLKDDNGEAFNVYAKFMTSNPVIKTISYVNYACFIIHALW
ncbi:MAG TPA: succinate dehydrogenase, partial [Chryseolinea sp.]|nr:succinate dehydrogenase [Chryseolinea sp.]